MSDEINPKRKFEYELADIISKFENETGVIVEEILPQRVENVDGSNSITMFCLKLR